MDTLTHALSGALLARATEPAAETATPPRRTRMAVCFWAAAFPDSDFVLRFIDPLLYLTAHRGITHSVVMLPIWAFGLALLFQLLYRGRYAWRSFFGICALGVGIHILGDVITSFGTMILAPFSPWRAQIPATFIIDPYFTSIIVGGLLASLYWKRTRTPAVVGLVVLVAYVGVQTILHFRALGVADAYIAAHRLEPAHSRALPQPFSPFHWLIVIEQPEAYHLSYVSLVRNAVRTPSRDAGIFRRVYDSYRPVDQALWETIPRYGATAPDRQIARAAWDADVFERFRRFAMLPAVYRVDRTDERLCVHFHDLRFRLNGRRIPFRYAACRENAGAEWRLFHVSGTAGAEILHLIE